MSQPFVSTRKSHFKSGHWNWWAWRVWSIPLTCYAVVRADLNWWTQQLRNVFVSWKMYTTKKQSSGQIFQRHLQFSLYPIISIKYVLNLSNVSSQPIIPIEFLTCWSSQNWTIDYHDSDHNMGARDGCGEGGFQAEICLIFYVYFIGFCLIFYFYCIGCLFGCIPLCYYLSSGIGLACFLQHWVLTNFICNKYLPRTGDECRWREWQIMCDHFCHRQTAPTVRMFGFALTKFHTTSCFPRFVPSSYEHNFASWSAPAASSHHKYHHSGNILCTHLWTPPSPKHTLLYGHTLHLQNLILTHGHILYAAGIAYFRFRRLAGVGGE